MAGLVLAPNYDNHNYSESHNYNGNTNYYDIGKDVGRQRPVVRSCKPRAYLQPLGLSEIRRKTQRCRENGYDGLENAYFFY